MICPFHTGFVAMNWNTYSPLVCAQTVRQLGCPWTMVCGLAMSSDCPLQPFAMESGLSRKRKPESVDESALVSFIEQSVSLSRARYTFLSIGQMLTDTEPDKLYTKTSFELLRFFDCLEFLHTLLENVTPSSDIGNPAAI